MQRNTIDTRNRASHRKCRFKGVTAVQPSTRKCTTRRSKGAQIAEIQNITSPAGGSGKKIRAGYLGHLTCLANRLADAATVRKPVAGALGAHPPWGEWVEGTLRGRNDLEDTMTWSCGRPSKREVASVNSVDELDADGNLFQVGNPPPPLSCQWRTCELTK